MKNKIRSPLFYVGDKYKLMPQIIDLFPQNINNYYEPFLGGGSSILYVEAQKYILNDLNKNIIDLHKHLSSFSKKPEELFEELFYIIDNYKLSCSYLGKNVDESIKKKYRKTYYSRYNKNNYLKLREDFNKDRNLSKLYLLLIYGFNHMIRFNNKNEFNLPVGNVDFNNNVYNALKFYLEYVKNRKIVYSIEDYLDFIEKINFKKRDFIYFDPPYLISNSEYNKNWDEICEKRLYDLIDKLNDKGVVFGLSNMIDHKGNSNIILKEWMKKYKIYDIKSNYISRFDNTIKKDSKEVYITNYEKD